jgi:hypothetical protein
MREIGMNCKRVIGVDVGKRWLDVAGEGGAAVERHANAAAAIAVLVARLDAAIEAAQRRRNSHFSPERRCRRVPQYPHGPKPQLNQMA